MKTYEQLLDETRVGTLHPGAGKYFLFIYWSYNSQHESILTRHISDILPLFLRAEEKGRHEPKELWWIEMVGPDPTWEERWRQATLDRLIARSVSTLRSMLSSSYEGKELPPGTRWCEDYVPNDEEDEDATPERDPRHYYCSACDGHRLILDLDHLLVHNRFEELDYWRRGPDRTPTPDPRRRTMDPDRRLYAFRCDGGHHHVGSMIQEVGSVDDLIGREHPAFLFHGHRISLPGSVTGYCTERDRLAEERSQLSEKLHREQMEEREWYSKEFLRYLVEGGEPPVDPDVIRPVKKTVRRR